MLNKSLLIVFLALALLAVPVLSDSTQQYNKIFLNPFYLPSLANNQNVSFLVTVNPPDHVESVVSAIINFQVYSTGQTVTYTLWVNNQACNNPSFTITTSVSGSGARSISFDCSNVITKAGTYNITMRPSGANEGATSGWLDLVYMNNPNGQIIMHGTDYTIDDNAKIWIQLLDSNLDAINNALCTADIYYPNGTRFREQQELSFLEDGVYTYDFIAPSTIGVYPAVARCFYGTGLKSFSLSNGTIINGTLNSGSYLDTFVNDGTTWSVSSIANNGTTQLLTLNLTFSNITQPANMTAYIFDIFTKTTIGVGTPISISFFNFTSNQLQAMPNPIIASAANSETSNTYFTNNLTNLGIMNSAGTILIQIKVLFTQGSSRTFQIDFAASQLVGLLNDSFQAVRGSSELNVRNMPLQVWNYTTRTLTDYNLSEILGIVTKINNTVITINGTASRIEVNTVAINSTVNRIESDSLAINSTVNRIDSTTLSINQTSTLNNLLLINLTSVVNSISSYLNGFITNILLSINSTVTSINAKNFTPTIIVNLTENETTNVFPTFNVSFNGTVNTVVVVNLTENETTNVFPTFNLTTNVTNVTVVVNTTNTTVVVNTTNTTVIVNTTQVNLQNITVVENITNTTVLVNATNLTELTGLAQDINLTGYQNSATLEKINNTVLGINSTVDSIQTYLLGFVTSSLNNIYVQTNFTVTYLINILTPVLGDFQTILTTINNTVTEINAKNFTVIENITNTTVVVNTTQVNLNNITVVVNTTNTTVVENITNTTVVVNTTQVNLQNITVVVNTTNTSVDFTPVLSAIEEVNQTTRANNAILQNLSVTTPQILGLLQYINQTFEVKLDNINSSANSLLNITGALNGTAGAIFNLLQQMNLTQEQIYLLVLSNSGKLDQNINLTNQTLQNTVQIVVLASQINSTTYQILGELQNLSITVNNTFTGNVTFNANLSSSTLSDISERVWLQFLTLGTPPLLHSTSYECIAPNTLAINNTFTVSTTSGFKQYTKLDTQYCQYGCDGKTQSCTPSPPDRLGMIAVIVGGILVFIGLVAKFV